jgi:hypothetical protein
MCQDYVRLGGDQLFREWLILTTIAAREASFDVNIAALGPSTLFEPLPKRSKARLRFRIVFGVANQHTDAPHPVCLLRRGGERPHNRRAAEQYDELAPLHLPPPAKDHAKVVQSLARSG